MPTWVVPILIVYGPSPSGPTGTEGSQLDVPAAAPDPRSPTHNMENTMTLTSGRDSTRSLPRAQAPTTLARTSPTPASTFKIASGSARVGPRLTITTARPSSAARRAKR